MEWAKFYNADYTKKLYGYIYFNKYDRIEIERTLSNNIVMVS